MSKKQIFTANYCIANVAGASTSGYLKEHGLCTAYSGGGKARSRSPLRAAQRAVRLAMAEHAKAERASNNECELVLHDGSVRDASGKIVYDIDYGRVMKHRAW
jgi:hypothetical protein